MKKTILTFAVGLSLVTFAQDGNNICVSNALQYYTTQGGDYQELERAMKCSDEAAANEKTSLLSKTFYYRAQLYTLISTDKTLTTKYPSAAYEASRAFVKLKEINDPKFRDWSDAMRTADAACRQLYNEAINSYEQKNFAQAEKYFYEVGNLAKVFEFKGQKSPIEPLNSLRNAATCADMSGNIDGAIKILSEIKDAGKADTITYVKLGSFLKKAGKKEEAMKIIDEALQKYPKDANLLIEKLNFYLDEQKYVEGLNYLNNLLEVNPDNSEALFIKGLAYENEKIRNEDSIVYYYNKAIEKNPKSSKSWNNLGAYYVTRANKLNEEIDKLGNSSSDSKKYDEIKAKQKELLLQAKPYFVKAKELSPNDQLIERNLKQIELKTQ